MSAPSKTYINQLVKIQPEESQASTSELNLTPERVIVRSEAKGKGYRATTKVKGLSSEIFNVSAADAVHIGGRQYFNNRKRRGCTSPTESETVARYQRVSMGTWETHCISAEKQICEDKPENGEDAQTIQWESDQFIVAMKQANPCGAKGLTKKPQCEETSSQTKSWKRGVNEITSFNHFTVSERVSLKSRMRENCTSGSVRGFIVSFDIRRWL